jgi:hypothetical protein
MNAQRQRTKAEYRPTSRSLETTVHTKVGAFTSLETEWDDLYCHSPRATPFQSWPPRFAGCQDVRGFRGCSGHRFRGPTRGNGHSRLRKVVGRVLERALACSRT